jgi:DNA-binding NtrC family response regulator
MSLPTQAKVLRVLQYGEFERLGGKENLKVNVRIIAATNKNLEKEVAAGRFREDLYWRLKVISIQLPLLRERPEDIPLLVEYFVSRFSEEYQTPIRYVADAAMQKLKSHSWPGNVRELENCIRRAVLLALGDVILEEYLKLEYDQQDLPNGSQLMAHIDRKLDELIPDILRLSAEKTHANVIDMVEKRLITKVLERCRYNQVKAARMLGISRNTLRHRIKKFQFNVPADLPENTKTPEME